MFSDTLPPMSLTVFSTYELKPTQRGVISEVATAQQMKNTAFRVSATPNADGVVVTVEDIAAKRKIADGPYYYHAVREGEKQAARTLENATRERRVREDRHPRPSGRPGRHA